MAMISNGRFSMISGTASSGLGLIEAKFRRMHAAFAARLSYSWQDDVLQEVGTNGLDSANDKAFGSLDADLSYRLNEQITVFAQGINITDEAQLQFVRDDRFSGYTRYGRTLMLGVRAGDHVKIGFTLRRTLRKRLDAVQAGVDNEVHRRKPWTGRWLGTLDLQSR